MKTSVILFMLIKLLAFSSIGQDLVDMSKDEIITYMSENLKKFRVDNTTKNDAYNYVKYVDTYGEQTIYYFLNDDNICVSSRLISDYSAWDGVINFLNAKFESEGENRWNYSRDRKDYEVELEEGEYYFTVYFRKKK